MKLYARGHAIRVTGVLVGRIAERLGPQGDPRDTIILLRNSDGGAYAELPECLAVIAEAGAALPERSGVSAVSGVVGLEYLEAGDVVMIAPDGLVRVLYRRSSSNNFLLITENCNSYCVMCSQPPRPTDDAGRLPMLLRAIELMDPGTRELGFTGGEPTLLKGDFLKLVEHAKKWLPSTALHVLTNGRAFYYREYALRLGAIRHPDMMLGIPLYADTDEVHDYIVQARGAFEQTMRGMQHLAHAEVPVEVRVVLHRETMERLPSLAEFIARNLPFAAQVVLMGLEVTGLTLAHPEKLVVDPYDHASTLRQAVDHLHASGMVVKLYNVPLCLLDRALWPFAVSSISDWKREYLPCCSECAVRQKCGGVFATSRGVHSPRIAALR